MPPSLLIPVAMKARVRCADAATIYIDGQYIATTSNTSDVWEADDVPDTISVIAVKCRTVIGSSRGLISWLSSGFTSGYY